ncbi:MAG: YdcF family protein [Rhodospirillaceae bacterium]|nr:MAG: YdcF family protein [Rhodospirillaceae bacterium]
MTIYQTLKSLALPPASLCLVFFAALIVSMRWRRLGYGLIWAVAVIFYLLAAPFSANRIGRLVATVPPLAADATLSNAKAIVVLSAGSYINGPEYGGAMLDRTTLERLRYAAHLYHRTPLPVLVSGGKQRGVPGTLAGSMKQALEEDFDVPVTWVEDRSADTIENARFSAEILKSAGITTIVLVTHATHMPRAMALFMATGLTVIPAPTGFPQAIDIFPADLIPRMAALDQSQEAIYEPLAGLWHGLRHDT